MARTARIIVAAAALCAVTGCSTRRLVFTTYTKVGLDVSTTDGNTPNGVFGYKRFEGAIIPYQPDPTGSKDAASVFAAMDVDNRWFGGLTIRQLFATGDAAVTAAGTPNALADAFPDADKPNAGK